MGIELVLVVNTALLSVIVTLATVIYKDMRSTMYKQGRQIIACMVAVIAVVNHMGNLPPEIIRELERELKGRAGD